jgi:hypothetical protein
VQSSPDKGFEEQFSSAGLEEKKFLVGEDLSGGRLHHSSRCVMCGEREEYLNHLMVDSLFTKVIWKYILNEFHLERNWGG